MVTLLQPAAANTEGQADPGTTDQPNTKNPELAALVREAAQMDASAAGAAAAPVSTSTADELGEALNLLRAVARPLFSDWPDYGREVWTDKQLTAISAAGGAIMDRHGWTMGELFAEWGPYIALIGATAPPALMTWQHLRSRKAIEQARARQRQQGAPGVPPEDADGVRP